MASPPPDSEEDATQETLERWEPPLRDRFGLWWPGRRRTRETETLDPPGRLVNVS